MSKFLAFLLFREGILHLNDLLRVLLFHSDKFLLIFLSLMCFLIDFLLTSISHFASADSHLSFN